MNTPADNRKLQRLKRIARRTAVALVAMTLAAPAAFFALDCAFPFPLERFAPPAPSPVVSDRGGNVLFARTAPDEQWRFPESLAQMNPLVVDALVAAEDQRFFQHAGVDPAAVLRAVWQNIASGRTVSGASTLTMQLCRMMDDRPRTWTAKAV